MTEDTTGRLDVLIMRLADRVAPRLVTEQEWLLLRDPVREVAEKLQRRLTR